MSKLTDCEETVFIECPSCGGCGGYDIGDCEDGIWETCEECAGTGEIIFVPERDAFTFND